MFIHLRDALTLYTITTHRTTNQLTKSIYQWLNLWKMKTFHFPQACGEVEEWSHGK